MALQELGRCILQSRRDPNVAAVEKGSECIKGATVKPDTDRAAELLPEPNCFPVLSQSLCPGDGLRGVSKSNTIGIAKVKPDRTAEFLRYTARHCIQRIEDTL